MTEPSIWDVRDNLDYDLPLDPGDPRLVPLNDARGQFSERRILRQLGGLGRCILFVVDGTDRLSGEDKEHFSVRDIHLRSTGNRLSSRQSRSRPGVCSTTWRCSSTTRFGGSRISTVGLPYRLSSGYRC